MMKALTLPNYPIMYKMNFIKGRLMKFQFDDFLFLYVYSGEGTMCVVGKDYPLSKGFGWLLSRNEQMTFHTGAFMQVIYIRISDAAVTEYLLRAASPVASVANKGMNDEDAHIQLVSNHVLLQGLVSGIEAGIDNNFRANEPLTYLKIQECIHVLTCLSPGLHNWFSRMNSLLKINLKDFMECHYKDNLPLEQLAQASGRSLSTFRRDFKNEFGTTPGKWLLARRLEEAYVLITQKNIRASAFLLDLGFESFPHFRAVSKLVLECSRLPFSIHHLGAGADDGSRFGKMTGYFARADRKSFPI